MEAVYELIKLIVKKQRLRTESRAVILLNTVTPYHQKDGEASEYIGKYVPCII